MTLNKNIVLRSVMIFVSLLLAVVSATAQITVSLGQTTALSVEQVGTDTYTWELYNDVNGINLAATQGNCPASQAYFEGGINTGASVNVKWMASGTYFFKVTATRPGCSMNLKLGKVIVTEGMPTAAIASLTPICAGDTAQMVITLSGQAPWSLKIFDGTNITQYDGITTSPFRIPVTPGTTTSYQVIEVTDQQGTNPNPGQPVQLIVKPRPISSHIYQY